MPYSPYEDEYASELVKIARASAARTTETACRIKVALDMGKVMAMTAMGCDPREIVKEGAQMGQGIPRPTTSSGISKVGYVVKEASILGAIGSATKRVAAIPGQLAWKGTKGVGSGIAKAHKVAPTLTKATVGLGVAGTGLGMYGAYKGIKSQAGVHQGMRHGAYRHGRYGVSPWKRSYQM